MNHSEWRTRRHCQLLGEHLDADSEYDRVYEEAGLAMTLGKAVYDRRKQLGLSEADLAERMHVDVDDIEGIETATELPSIDSFTTGASSSGCPRPSRRSPASKAAGPCPRFPSCAAWLRLLAPT
ncbi:multiprotein-bridging factor 1 family protein [Streptomyces bottropensis]|uniref:helix-turn-helix domain-containing protein n=1 Tax=Streptomyces bottropensis TaxID=42235 RepID=UPI003693E974